MYTHIYIYKNPQEIYRRKPGILTSPNARQSDMDCAIKENWRSLGERGQDLGEKRT